MSTAADVAEFIIGTEMRAGTPVLTLRLALYLYFAQLESFAKRSKALFPDDISTRRPFPCVDSVYYKYNIYADGILLDLPERLPLEEAALVRPLLERLRRKAAWELVAMTKQPCSPFMKAKQEGAPLTTTFFKELPSEAFNVF